MIFKKIKKNRGFVILFAVMLSSIILAVSLGVANIALKEIKFATSAKDTNNAFFAADTGIECALLNDKTGSVSFSTDQADHNSLILQHQCLGSDVSLLSTTIDWASTPWNFAIFDSNNACANITITKENNTDGVLVTTITSKGYNRGILGGDLSCIPNSNSVERELQVTY